MTTKPQIRVLFFDVFGTCVMQRKPVADELWRATQEALESTTAALSEEVRAKASKLTYEDWFEFGAEWNKEGEKFVRASIANGGTVDWKAVDNNRIGLLAELLARRGLIVQNEDPKASKLQVGKGSLWNEAQLNHLGRVWHRLTPWPDTCRGLELLNKRFQTVTLSNAYNELTQELVKRGNMPYTQVYTADLFNSYKPNAKVYLGAAEKMGVKPEECALVAAHLGDLKGAKACGFQAFYVTRPLEEKAPELREENIPDLTIKEDEEGLIALAARLGYKHLEVDLLTPSKPSPELLPSFSITLNTLVIRQALLHLKMLGDLEAKHVRRADLHSPASSPRSTPDAELLDIFNRRVQANLEVSYDEQPIIDNNDTQKDQSEDELEFRLFASAPTAKQTQSVRIRSPSIEKREPGLVRPSRPDSYYFTNSTDAATRARFAAAAVEGHDVVARSKTACPGCRLPWRVTSINAAQDRGTALSTSKSASTDDTRSSKKKTKPGKKHRIALRIKARAQQKSVVDKEAAEREKRTRRNREKKVKRKEKEKAKKTASSNPV